MKFTSLLYSFLTKNRIVLPVGITILTLITLFLTLIPADVMGENKLWDYDKLGHMVLFGSWCLSVGLYYQISYPPVKLWVVFGSGVFFGLMIELLQHYLPVRRHGDPIDFIFDILGCLAAIWILHKVRQIDDSSS
jgi:VanZ family protein